MTRPISPPVDAPSGEAAVRASVVAALGLPPGLHELVVRPLWAGHYRVNVFVGPDAVSARIAHSYFVEAAADGTILGATPPLTRSYR